MRICFVADARSAISRNWIRHFVRSGHEVHVISSYACPPELLDGAEVHELNVAFSGFAKVKQGGSVEGRRPYPIVSTFLAELRTGRLAGVTFRLRHWLAPLEIHRHTRSVRRLLSAIRPDIVHAMRVPFEGILAAQAVPADMPLLISVWGNDFTLFADRFRLIGRQTRAAMRRADGLHCDCRRDLDLAHEWGFDRRKVAAVLPGAGGIDVKLFHAGEPESGLRTTLDIPQDAPVVINPRGFRNYVRNDLFFEAVPRVLRENPNTVFVCPAMEANPVAEKWVKRFGVERNVRLLASASRQEMAALFRLADVSVSPSEHDGTPNTLLEAMACGCIPVAGDIESVREWIVDGVNGLLWDLGTSGGLAAAIGRALNSPELRNTARERNMRLISDRAEYGKVMSEAEELYVKLISS